MQLKVVYKLTYTYLNHTLITKSMIAIVTSYKQLLDLINKLDKNLNSFTLQTIERIGEVDYEVLQ